MSLEWIAEFNRKIRVKAFEQFSLLLCDIDTSDAEQKEKLEKILFNDHTSPVFWLSYVDYVSRIFPERKLQLQRLVNKALELIDESSNKDVESYIKLHLQSAALKRCHY